MTRILISWMAALMMGMVAVTAVAEDYMEGVEYTRISKPLRTVSQPGKIEVREYFWYGCPHCFRLEPFIQRWLATNPENVNLQMQPAILGESWAPAAQAFYVAALLGVLDRVHPALFEAVHLDGQKSLVTDDLALELFFEEYGVKPELFRKTWSSFGVQSRVKQAVRMTRRSGIKGVPSIVVNGKYVTDPGRAGGGDEMFRVIEYVVAQGQADSS